ncbi:MAG: fatty-acid--CoA ligase, partial [Deltaproteobacteria bacterium]|nr:fatty-acid--CoA ligase [Deltaproteobacteria bacterium]
IGVPHPEWGETVVAMIVPAKDKNLNEDILKSFLGDKLAGYKTPRTIKFVDELPHTPSGKVMKYKLRED